MKTKTTKDRRSASNGETPGKQVSTGFPRWTFALIATSSLIASSLVLAQTKGDPPIVVLDPSGVPAVLDSLDRNYDAILEVPVILQEELPDPGTVVPGVAHESWLIPEVRIFEHWNSDDRLTYRSTTRIKVLNTGDTAATVSCIYFDQSGVLDLDQGMTTSVASAARANCQPYGTSYFEGWVLVTSDLPVIVTADVHSAGYEGGQYITPPYRESARDVPAHPIDCNHPEGIEFACQFVTP